MDQKFLSILREIGVVIIYVASEQLNLTNPVVYTNPFALDICSGVDVKNETAC